MGSHVAEEEPTSGPSHQGPPDTPWDPQGALTQAITLLGREHKL